MKKIKGLEAQLLKISVYILGSNELGLVLCGDTFSLYLELNPVFRSEIELLLFSYSPPPPQKKRLLGNREGEGP